MIGKRHIKHGNTSSNHYEQTKNRDGGTRSSKNKKGKKIQPKKEPNNNIAKKTK